MSERITKKDIEQLVNILNQVTSKPRPSKDYYKASNFIGLQYKFDYYYREGNTSLVHRIELYNEEDRTSSDVSNLWGNTKKELFDKLTAFLNGFQLAEDLA